MGYRTALTFRWSRRDRLTVVVVAVTAAFLIGTTLLLFTAVSYSQTFAEPLANSATVSYETADGDPPTGGEDAHVLPMATATTDEGPVRVVGVPSDAPRVIQNGSASWQQGRLPELPATADARGPVSGEATRTLTGSAERVRLSVVPSAADNRFFGSEWYVTDPATVDRLGVSGYLVLDTGPETTAGFGGVPDAGAPLVGALLYVLGGLEQVLLALGIAVAGGGLLVLVVVYSVTRMSVRDRTEAIRVVRSTGATGRQVGALFTARATTIVAVGVALGYAVGLVAIKAIVNAAIYLGFPIALDVSVTGQNALVVAGVAGSLLLVGVLAGALAAYPAAVRPPATLGSGRSRPASTGPDPGGRVASVRATVSPSLLSWRSIVPTAATLAVFALTFLLVASIGGLATPMGGDAGGTGTVTEAGATHPLNSRLDADYARVMRADGTEASPEILYAQVSDGQPYLAHGARYDAFANVTGATLVAGERPTEGDEAVVGADLARTLDVGVGDTLTAGGSVKPGVRRYDIVGEYRARGTLDDLLVVPLASAAELATREGQVHMIRVDGPVSTGEGENGSRLAVTGITGPETVTRGDRLPVSVTVRNFGDEPRSRSVTVRYRGETRTTNATVSPGGESTATVRFVAEATGTASAGAYAHDVTVVDPDAIRIPSRLPSRAPPGATMIVPVVTADDERVANATVSVGERTVRTGERGAVPVALPDEGGNHTITARRGARTATREIRVVPGTRRHLAGDLQVSPRTGTVLTEPTVTAELWNPWQRTLTRSAVVDGPDTARERVVTLAPGNASRTTFDGGSDSRSQPGTYAFDLRANGTAIASAEYTVTGDDRLGSAVASSGQYAGGTTVERSVEGVFGNVQIVLAVMVVLAAVSTVGSITATFAQAVHARRRAIGVYRSTGATRTGILRLVLADVVRISVPATFVAVPLAVAGMALLERSGHLVFFGFRLASVTPPRVLAALAVVGVALAVVGALVATVPYVRASPVSLLPAGDRVHAPTRPGEDGVRSGGGADGASGDDD